MTIFEIEELIEEALELQNEVLNRLAIAPGHMNLLELSSLSHLENYHSDVIAFLINPHAEHRHEEYGKLFLNTLVENGLNIKDQHVSKVEREKSTETGRRIDILIRTSRDIIVVENKIFAGDLTNQIADYLDFCKKIRKTENIHLVYLTLDGHEMSEHSLSSSDKKLLLKEQRGIFISYKDTILPWLDKLSSRVSREEELRSAIVQYKDAIKGFYKLREDHQMAVHHFFNHFYSEYENRERENFQKVLGSVQNLYQVIKSIHLIKVLLEINNSLSKTHGSEKVFITIGQKRYSSHTRWLENIDLEESDVGVELALEKDGEHPFGLAIELSSLDETANLYFGIMSHGDDWCKEGRFLKILNEEKGWIDYGHTFQKNAYWCAFTRANWARSRILSLGSESNGKMASGRDIVQHIVERWFNVELINRLVN